MRWQLDLDTGKITWPKDDDGRWVVMSPRFRAHLETMPRRGKTIDRTKGEIVFPATRGGYMLRSTWCNLWALSTRVGRDARPGVLRVEASRDSMDD